MGKRKTKSVWKRVLLVIGIIAGIILAALVCYIIYLFASYHRIEDNLALTVEKPAEKETSGGQEKDEAMDLLTVGKEYTALGHIVRISASLWTEESPPGPRVRKASLRQLRGPGRKCFPFPLILHWYRRST